MFGNHSLELGRIDVETCGDDHVLQPVHHVEVAVLVLAHEVAGIQPAVSDNRIGGGVGLAEIAGHYHRTANLQLADFPRWQYLA
ncbi:hypothetical protein D3C85_1598650 [compost metagenome]